MRYTTLGVLALGLVVAACGSSTEQRAASGGGTGLLVGALAGGPLGAGIGLGAGSIGGTALDEGVDKKTTDAVEKVRGTATSSGTSGSSAASTRRLGDDQIRDRLMRDGYTDVGLFRRDGDTYKATANKDGQRYDLTIDANSGRVRDSRRI
jgi:hypothetical protein